MSAVLTVVASFGGDGLEMMWVMGSEIFAMAEQFDEPDHKQLALWAADCAERVLPHFGARHPQDDRPRRAIEAVRAWVKGERTVGEARVAAFAAHAAARDADGAAARAAARAAGHAAATAHVATHARHAAAYAAKAAAAAIPNNGEMVAVAECDWQQRRLPDRLRLRLHPLRMEAVEVHEESPRTEILKCP